MKKQTAPAKRKSPKKMAVPLAKTTRPAAKVVIHKMPTGVPGLDDIMDFMEEAVDLVLLYEVTSLPAETTQQVEVLQRCAELTAEAMPQLESMGSLDEYWIEVNRLENTGDKSYRRILANLFSGEFEALEVLKLKDIVESLEGAIDAFEKVANIVEQIAVKES